MKIPILRLAAVVALVVGAACASPAAQERPDVSAAGEEPSSPAVGTELTEPDPEQEPTPIDGTYASGEYLLRLDAGRWSVNFPPRQGDFRVDGDQLVLFNEAGCPGDGTYGWVLGDGHLVLTKVEDRCGARNARFPSVWKWSVAHTLKERPAPGEFLLLSDGQHVAPFAGRADVTGREEVTIEVSTTNEHGLVFSPTVLVGSPGQTLAVTLRNPERRGTENQQHNFNIDELEIAHVEVPYGGVASVTLTLPNSGAVRFYCDYHYRFGQQGEFLVR